MVTKQIQNKTDYVQFSKKLTMVIVGFWCAYRILIVLLSFFRVDTAEAFRIYTQGVDDVMMTALCAYTGNSIAEKGIIGYFGRKQEEKEKDEDVNG